MKSFEKATPFLLGISKRTFKQVSPSHPKIRNTFLSCEIPFQINSDHQAVYLESTKLTDLTQWQLPSEARTPKKQRIIWARP